MLADESDDDLTVLWKPWDRRLMRALLAYEQTLCHDCRQDRRRSMNPDMEGYFEVRSHRCYCCSSLEDARAKSDRPKGFKDFVVDSGPDTADLMPFQIDLTPEGGG